MAEANEPGIISIFAAIRKLIDNVPKEGQTVDWQELKRQQEIAQAALSAIEKCFTQEPLNSEMRRCEASWPRIWN